MNATVVRHWSRLPEAGASLGLHLLYAVHRTFGRWPFRLLLLPVAGYFLLTRATARRASMDYLSALDPEAGRLRLLGRSFRHFFAFGESLLEKGLAWTGWVPEDIELRGMQPLKDRVRKQKKGALLLVSHLGNSELAHAIAKLHHDVNVTVLVHTRHAVRFNRFLRRINPRSQVNLMQVTQINAATSIALLERVQAGQLVVIAADRVPVASQGRVVAASFVGRDAAFPAGPYVLAGLLQVPVWLMFCLRLRDKHLVAFEPFCERVNLRRPRRDAQLRGLAAAYAARLEHYCRQAPYQWFNFYPFWQSVDIGERQHDS